MTPVECVHEEAVGEKTAPGGEERGRPDSVCVTPGQGISHRESKRREEQGKKCEQAEETVLGECADVQAMCGDGPQYLVLARADAERIARALIDAEELRTEPLLVV